MWPSTLTKFIRQSGNESSSRKSFAPNFKRVRLTGTLALLLLKLSFGFAQTKINAPSVYQKGTFYVYWGWNWDSFTKSDISFLGNDYNFTLNNVVAHSHQSSFDLGTYFNPLKLSTPQYNFRFGYFLTKHYNVSFGIDHMKYIVQGDQVVKITGSISNSGTAYDGVYSNDDIAIKKDFLQFEHTDGLNYVNFEFRRMDNILTSRFCSLNITEGLGMGMLVPRSNVTLLNNPRHDEFHLAGYGIDAVIGINFTFYKNFFLQTEFKGGYINMPDIRTTFNSPDRASQHFFFTQYNFVIGKFFTFSKKYKEGI